ncbi:MAG: PEP-CTERM sorting domain-containing protein [Verrucomicrobiota bacterium JB022]|nr:PEP-CTERM sorting domain-containing protein [Verrucomicrobiota bacterium JB022]
MLPLNLSTTALFLCALASSASAALLLDPSAGTVRLSNTVGDSNKDDGVYHSSYYLSDDFFGSPLMNPFVTVSINGHIRFGNGDGDGDYFLQPLGNNAINRVAPMWADFNLGTSGQIVDEVGSSYYAVSWLNLENAENPGTVANLQAIFIEGDTTLNGNAFQAGDIVFSYGEISIYPAISEVIIGLESENGDTATLPGHEVYGGWHSYDVFGDFPVGENQYALFRPDGLGSYSVSIQDMAAIPEPATYAAVFGGLALAGAALRRRRA